jgi:DNA invertase Pin-like site-specific DNA recombinase
MANGKFVSYLRVSTQQQGVSGLGVEAQREAVVRYLNGGQWTLEREFVEVESGKGANALDRRPQLKAALALCKKTGATLIVGKLDRLARNVHFISGLIESGVEFVPADMPQANKVMLQMHAVMAEWERDQISARTKAALAAAKARGVKLGIAGPTNLKPNVEQRQREAADFAERLRPTLTGMLATGRTRRQMVADLDALGIKTPRGKAWSLAQLQSTLERLGLVKQATAAS